MNKSTIFKAAELLENSFTSKEKALEKITQHYFLHEEMGYFDSDDLLNLDIEYILFGNGLIIIQEKSTTFRYLLELSASGHYKIPDEEFLDIV